MRWRQVGPSINRRCGHRHSRAGLGDALVDKIRSDERFEHPSMKSVFEEVALICPEGVTGGPEAIHQLAHAINSFGGRACLMVFGGESKLDIVSDNTNIVLRCSLDPHSPMRKTYEKYQPRTIPELSLNQNTLCIFPEMLVETARNFSGRRAIWWLSVDNAILRDPRLKYQSFRDFIFNDPTLIHFWQSDYARDFLSKNGARQFYPLSDYTDEMFLSASAASTSAKDGRIAYFPQKGAELAALLIAAGSDLKFAAIQNMTKAQVKETLESCSIYIDFGHHPGRDRVPREAAAAGAVVLLHDCGSAAFFADHPLDRSYLFSLADIQNGSLLSRVKEILADHAGHVAKQHYYRQRIRLEKAEFDLQVKRFFFDGI
jgi:hypothetical protein